MTEHSVQDPRDAMIRLMVRGRTFVDVGGLWGLHGEKVSVAHQAGASAVTMADARPLSDPLWHQFQERMHQRAMFNVGMLSNPLDLLVGRVWDVVHCSGVLYHLPDPIAGLRQLHSITGKYCILGSMVGPADYPTILVPQLPTLESVESYPNGLHSLFADWFGPVVADGALGITAATEWRPGDYDPWWWIPSNGDLWRWCEEVGFKVIQREYMLDGRVAVLALERSE